MKKAHVIEERTGKKQQIMKPIFKKNDRKTFILTRSRNWIQQLAMQAPVLRNKSDGAEPRRTPMSNLTSEEPGISRPTADS